MYGVERIKIKIKEYENITKQLQYRIWRDNIRDVTRLKIKATK